MDTDVTVREVMNREFLGVSESDTVVESAELMLEDGAESVVVVRGQEPVGLVTERDALRALVDGAEDAPVTEVMTEPVPTVTADRSVGEAADEMSTQGTQRLVVTEGDSTVGVVSEHDLITTSPFATEPRVADEPETAVVGHADDRTDDRTMTETADQGFEEQSICEACGSFARDLAPFNGQVLCGDCRDI